MASLGYCGLSFPRKAEPARSATSGTRSRPRNGRISYVPLSCTSQLQSSSSSSSSDGTVEDVVIVGAGVSGLATALALTRLGIKPIVLEQSRTLRVTGTALAVWTNGWRVLEELEVAEELRKRFVPLNGFDFYTYHDKLISSLNFSNGNKPIEIRGVDRRVLLETLANALPPGIVSFSSQVKQLRKVPGSYMQVELQNGSTLQTKILVGCDGVGSVVAKHIGLSEAHYVGYTGIRGLAVSPDGHQLPAVLKQSLGRGIRFGYLPLDSRRLYWFLVFKHPAGTRIVDPTLVKEEALRLVEGWPRTIADMIRISSPDTISRSAISDRWMWPWMNHKMYRDGVTVAGDAMHPITPNLAQGGCSALEDGVVLGRSLSKALKSISVHNLSPNEELDKIGLVLQEYIQERQRRMLRVGMLANLIGKILQIENEALCSLRDLSVSKLLSPDIYVQHSSYDVGDLA